MPTALDKLAFDAAQAARVGWFFGQKLLAARLSRPVPLPAALRGRPMPDRRRILGDLRALIEQDWRNIEAGRYAPPADGIGSPVAALRRAVRFLSPISRRSTSGATARPATGCCARRRPEITRATTCRNSIFRATAI